MAKLQVGPDTQLQAKNKGRGFAVRAVVGRRVVRLDHRTTTDFLDSLDGVPTDALDAVRSLAESVAEARTEAARARWAEVLAANAADREALRLELHPAIRVYVADMTRELSQSLSIDAEVVQTCLAWAVGRVPSDLRHDIAQVVAMRLLEAKAGIALARDYGAYAFHVTRAAVARWWEDENNWLNASEPLEPDEPLGRNITLSGMAAMRSWWERENATTSNRLAARAARAERARLERIPAEIRALLDRQAKLEAWRAGKSRRAAAPKDLALSNAEEMRIKRFKAAARARNALKGRHGAVTVKAPVKAVKAAS